MYRGTKPIIHFTSKAIIELGLTKFVIENHNSTKNTPEIGFDLNVKWEERKKGNK